MRLLLSPAWRWKAAPWGAGGCVTGSGRSILGLAAGRAAVSGRVKAVVDGLSRACSWGAAAARLAADCQEWRLQPCLWPAVPGQAGVVVVLVLLLHTCRTWRLVCVLLAVRGVGVLQQLEHDGKVLWQQRCGLASTVWPNPMVGVGGVRWFG